MMEGNVNPRRTKRHAEYLSACLTKNYEGKLWFVEPATKYVIPSEQSEPRDLRTDLT